MNEFYSGNAVRKEKCTYSLIIGERSNGKTFDFGYYALKKLVKSKYEHTTAVIRRLEEDFVAPNGAKTMFNGLACDAYGVNHIARLTKNEFTKIIYFAGRYYLGSIDQKTGKDQKSDIVFAYAFSLSASAADHYKSANIPSIKTIIFDEFITRTSYLNNEFIVFMNLISTIVRQRDDVEIFMLGNTVNKYCPYFREMGLTRIHKMKPGEIDVYKYGDRKLSVAVEYTKSTGGEGKKSDVYFAFDNPRLKMITTGEWEIGVYPHLEIKYTPKDVLFVFFIIFDRDILQCEVIKRDGESAILFVHPKTTPLKNPDEDLIYHTGYSERPNWRRKITDGTLKVEKRIIKIFKEDRVFYSDNESGEVLRNYLMWCRIQ